MRSRATLVVAILLTLDGCAVPWLTPSDRSSTTPGAMQARPALLPVGGIVRDGRINSVYGWRGPSLGGSGSWRHDGIDISAPRGTPIHAAADGTVKDIATRGDYGRLVILRHPAGLETLYAHLAHTTRSLRIGAPVRQGEVIGYVGSTGNATGPHLHFEVRRDGVAVDPSSLMPVR